MWRRQLHLRCYTFRLLHFGGKVFELSLLSAIPNNNYYNWYSSSSFQTTVKSFVVVVVVIVATIIITLCAWYIYAEYPNSVHATYTYKQTNIQTQNQFLASILPASALPVETWMQIFGVGCYNVWWEKHEHAHFHFAHCKFCKQMKSSSMYSYIHWRCGNSEQLKNHCRQIHREW